MNFSTEKKVNSAALRKAAKEARQAQIERDREVTITEGDSIILIPFLLFL